MLVPSHMHITASLMAGYTFDDGSLLEVDADGDYRITNANGEVLAETVDTQPGEFAGLNTAGGPPRAGDYGDIVDDLAAFLSHDADLYESTMSDMAGFYEDAKLSFALDVAMWAYEHVFELEMLACYREDKRLTKLEVQ